MNHPKRLSALFLAIAMLALAVPAPAASTAMQPGLPPPTGEAAKAGKSGRVLRVGPGQAYRTAASAAKAARNGDCVEIEAGTYKGDVATWNAEDLLIRGVGGMAHIDADGKNEGNKGIWVVRGRNTVVENIELSGCTVRDRNGSGIRIETKVLTVRHCYFHDNDDGLLGGNGSDIILEYCEFFHNGNGDGYSHNMYIGHANSFIMRYCYSHGAKIGHDVKSRAAKNLIMCNRIMDEADGTASYTIDLPNGGLAVLIGNVVEKGPRSSNSSCIVEYAGEGPTNLDQRLYVINNTIVNDRAAGAFIKTKGNPTVKVMNNLFIGPGKTIDGKGDETANLVTRDKRVLVDAARYDYRLADNSPARGKGANPGKLDDLSLTPAWQYVDKATFAARNNRGGLDIGAYEYGFVPPKKPIEIASLEPASTPKPAAKPTPPPEAKPAAEPKPLTPPPKPVERTPDQICESWFSMAVNYQNAGFKEDAVTFFQKIVDGYPTSSWAEKAREQLKQAGG